MSKVQEIIGYIKELEKIDNLYLLSNFGVSKDQYRMQLINELEKVIGGTNVK